MPRDLLWLSLRVASAATAISLALGVWLGYVLQFRPRAPVLLFPWHCRRPFSAGISWRPTSPGNWPRRRARCTPSPWGVRAPRLRRDRLRIRPCRAQPGRFRVAHFLAGGAAARGPADSGGGRHRVRRVAREFGLVAAIAWYTVYDIRAYRQEVPPAFSLDVDFQSAPASQRSTGRRAPGKLCFLNCWPGLPFRIRAAFCWTT